MAKITKEEFINSLKEMTNMVLESELVRKTKEHSEEISKKSKIKKAK